MRIEEFEPSPFKEGTGVLKVKKIVVPVLILVIMGLPGVVLCGSKKQAFNNRTVFYPYYDILSNASVPVKAEENKSLVPESILDRKAIGYGSDPGLHNGLSFRYWFREDMAINVNGKLLLEAENNNFEYNFNIRPKLIYNISKGDRLLINLFGGIDVLFSGNIDNTNNGDWHLLYALAGIAPEYFITENMSIEASFGVYLELLGGGDTAGVPYRTLSFGTLGAGASLPVISLHIYF